MQDWEGENIDFYSHQSGPDRIDLYTSRDYKKYCHILNRAKPVLPSPKVVATEAHNFQTVDNLYCMVFELNVPP